MVRTLRVGFSTFEVSLKVAKTREKQNGHFKGHESRKKLKIVPVRVTNLRKLSL